MGGTSIAAHLIEWLDGPAWFMGLNGMVLLAYVLAIPANEIVVPTILMLTLMALGQADGGTAGVLMEGSDEQTRDILLAGGWNLLTAVNLMLFCLLHHPCSTTLYSIYKETRSWRWTHSRPSCPWRWALSSQYSSPRCGACAERAAFDTQLPLDRPTATKHSAPIALSTLKNRGWGARSAVFFVISHLLHDIKCKNHRRLPKTIGEVRAFPK